MKITKRQLKRIIRESASLYENNPYDASNQRWKKMYFDAGFYGPEKAEKMGMTEDDLAEFDGMEIIGTRAVVPGYYDLEMANGETLYAISTVHIVME